MASDSDGRRRRMRILGAVAIALAVVLLVLSLLISVTRWEVTTYNSFAGASMAWDTDRTHLFVQRSGSILTMARDENRLSLVSVFVHDPERISGGPLAFRDGWLFHASADSTFTALDVHDARAPIPHGPAPMYMAAGGSAVIPRELVVFGNDVLLRGQRLEPNRAEVIVAFDMSEPSAVTSDPASLRSRYVLEVTGGVSDILVRGSTLYLSEPAGTVRTYDLATVPPTALGAFNLDGPILGMDVLDSTLALVPGVNSRTVRLFDLGAGQPALLSAVSLDHEPARVVLEGERAYIEWVDANGFGCGLTILQIGDRASPREIMTSRFGLLPGELLVDQGTVFFSDALDLHVVREAAVPSIVGSLWMQVALAASASTAVAAWVAMLVPPRVADQETNGCRDRTR